MHDADANLPAPALAESERLVLLRVARDAIDHGLRFGEPLSVDLGGFEPRLLVEHACFVSLHCGEELRGCVGALEARLPLVRQVAESAYDAAFRDLRLAPVRPDELLQLTIEVSVLSPLTAIAAESERALLDRLRPGIDGIVVREGAHRATFLPKVWEAFPLPYDFVEHLKRKAGLPARYWSPTMRFERYTVDSFGIVVADLD